MNLDKIKTFEDLKMAKAKFYGPNSELRTLQAQLKSAPPEQKSLLGKKISQLKKQAEISFHEKAQEISAIIINEKIAAEKVDVSLPQTSYASLHPLTLIENRLSQWLLSNGYFQTEGSEIETDEYNFERLNIGLDHPARAMQDSLYFDDKKLLRTHNTGFTARELAKHVNKAFGQFAIGPVYRNDEDDATHSHQFSQCDLVLVGHVSFPNLIYTLKQLISYVLETEVKIRLRPSFFPFTEPSVEVDIFYKDKWIEILGAGMLHPHVLKKAGYTNDMNGFAAGIGIERMAMIKYEIKDIREFYKNDLRFLNQFKGVN